MKEKIKKVEKSQIDRIGFLPTKIETRSDFSCASSGFTLIEVLIYSAILGIILSSSLTMLYSVSAGRAQALARQVLESEGNMLMSKLTWAMTSAKTINLPAANSTSTVLSLSRYDSSDNPMVFGLNGGVLGLSRAGQPAKSLTSNEVVVTDFTVSHLPALNGQPEGVALNISISTYNLLAQTAMATTTLVRTIYLRQ